MLKVNHLAARPRPSQRLRTRALNLCMPCAQANSSPRNGGALYFESTTAPMTVYNASFVNNTAQWGGAVRDLSTSSPFNFTSCLFQVCTLHSLLVKAAVPGAGTSYIAREASCSMCVCACTKHTRQGSYVCPSAGRYTRVCVAGVRVCACVWLVRV